MSNTTVVTKRKRGSKDFQKWLSEKRVQCVSNTALELLEIRQICPDIMRSILEYLMHWREFKMGPILRMKMDAQLRFKERLVARMKTCTGAEFVDIIRSLKGTKLFVEESMNCCMYIESLRWQREWAEAEIVNYGRVISSYCFCMELGIRSRPFYCMDNPDKCKSGSKNPKYYRGVAIHALMDLSVETFTKTVYERIRENCRAKYT
jgi:hypothetical protein